MKVIWFNRAIWDLKAAKDYIAQDNPQAAQQIVQRIKDQVSLLNEQPGIGRPGRVPNTKELVVDRTAFIFPYRVRDNKIEILRVLENLSTSSLHPPHVFCSRLGDCLELFLVHNLPILTRYWVQ